MISLAQTALDYYASSLVRYFQERLASPDAPVEDFRHIWALHAADTICRQAPLLGVSLLERTLETEPSEFIRENICIGQLVSLLNAVEAQDRPAMLGLMRSAPRLMACLRDVWRDGLEDHAVRFLDALENPT